MRAAALREGPVARQPPTLAALTPGAAIAPVFRFASVVRGRRPISRLGSQVEGGLGPAVVHEQMRDAVAGETIDGSPIRDVKKLRGVVTSRRFAAPLGAL